MRGSLACSRSAPSSKATIALVRSFSTNSRPALRPGSNPTVTREPTRRPLRLIPDRCGPLRASRPASGRVAPRSWHQPAWRYGMHTAGLAGVSAFRVERLARCLTQHPARQEPPRPRPGLAWPQGPYGCRGRRPPGSRGRRRSPAAPRACGAPAEPSSRQSTTPAPPSAAVARLVAAAPRLRYQGVRSDVGPAHRTGRHRDQARAWSPGAWPARRQLRRLQPGPRPPRRL
jgi:hypothetical protein